MKKKKIHIKVFRGKGIAYLELILKRLEKKYEYIQREFHNDKTKQIWQRC